MANLNTYATATPVLTDYASGVDDPVGTWSVKNFTFSAIRDLLQANLTSATITGATLTGSAADSLLSLTQTWNTTGTPTAIKLDVTDTASNASSLLLALQVGGASKFSVAKNGNLTIPAGQTISSGGSAAIKFNGGFRVVFSSVGGSDMVSIWDGLRVGQFNPFGWTTGTGDSGTFDTKLWRDAASTVAQRNGTIAQAFRIYNTHTDASNYERAELRWNANVFEVGSFAAGTGTLRGLRVGVSGNSIGFLGATPIAQYSTTGTTTGFTAGAGTAVNDDSTFTGNTGATAYTIGDVVRALKQYGLIAS